MFQERETDRRMRLSLHPSGKRLMIRKNLLLSGLHRDGQSPVWLPAFSLGSDGHAGVHWRRLSAFLNGRGRPVPGRAFPGIAGDQVGYIGLSPLFAKGAQVTSAIAPLWSRPPLIQMINSWPLPEPQGRPWSHHIWAQNKPSSSTP